MSAARLRAARDEIDTTTRKLKEAFAALAPWRGNAEALALAAVPDEAETAELRRRVAKSRRFAEQASDLSGGQDSRSGTAAGRSGGRRRARRICSATRLRPRFARRAMRRGWRIARASIGRAPTLFEAAMRRDDAAGATTTWPVRGNSPPCASARSSSQALKRNGSTPRPTSKRRTSRSPRSISRSRRLRPSRRRKGGTRLPSSTRGGLSATRR